MKISRWLVGAGLAFLLAGCVTSPHLVDFSSAADVQANTGRFPDPDRNRVVFKAPLFATPLQTSPRKQTSLFLQAFESHNGKTAYRVFIHFYFEGDWRGFNQAVDGDGNQLNLKPLEKATSHCSPELCMRTEDVEVTVSQDYLEKHAGSGLELVVSSGTNPDAAERIRVPGSYIRGFLDKVSSH